MLAVTSYIDSDIPLVLVGDVYTLKRSEQGRWWRKREVISLAKEDGHAVTVLGYDFRIGSNLIYVHDDRLGPYARIELVELKDLLGKDTPVALRDRWALAFRKTKDNGRTWLPAHEILIPDACIVPADKKARLPFQYAYGTAEVIADRIRFWLDPTLNSSTSLLQSNTLKFNIKLSTISEVRERVREHKLDYQGNEILSIDADEDIIFAETDLERWREERIRFLTSPMARLQWEIDFLWGNKEVFKVLLDATDIPLGNAVSGVYVSDPHAELFFGILQMQDGFDPESVKAHFYGSFVTVLEQREEDYASHLNKTYGALRAPIKIEDSEVDESGKGRHGGVKHRFDPKGEKLTDLFPEIVADPVMRNLIWAIGRDGSLFVAEDITVPKLGHLSMTGLQAARIAGEIWWTEDEGKAIWHVNHSSGRYSRDYVTPNIYLDNAVTKIASFFEDDIKFVAKGKARPPLVEARFEAEKAKKAQGELA